MGKLVTTLEVVVGILIGVAYITLAERKVMGAMQRRKGPNIVGIYGLIQPVLDGLKLFIKEILVPQQVNRGNYMIGPMVTLALSLIIWVPIPLSYLINKGGVVGESGYSIIYILAISSISVYILLYTGWSSNSKYTFIGAIRAIAQMISYEVSMGIIIMAVIILNNSLNLLKIEYASIYLENIFTCLPVFLLFLVSALAETNRPPFDLPEAESELVAGVLTEYGGMAFASLYLAEYAFVQSMSLLTSILFLGNTLYTPLVILIFIWARASLPRIKYDQLMSLGWTKLLPFSISYLVLLFSLYLLFL